MPPADGEDGATPSWPQRDRDDSAAQGDAEDTELTPAVPSPAWDDEPPRAEPTRIEPPEPGAEQAGGERPEPRRRRRRRLVLSGAGVLAVLVLAAAALVFVPGAAQKVGLSGVGTPATSPPPEPGPLKPRVVPAGSSAPAPSPSGVATALSDLASDPSLGTLTGEVIDPRSGKRLWAAQPRMPQAPGSTNKLLTAAAALLALSPRATLETKVVAGSTPGTVVIVGGGDPTLSSLPGGKQSVYPGAAHLDDLVAQVKKNHSGPITTVKIDETRYAGPTKAPGWNTADIARGNWTPIVPGMLDGGRKDPTVAEGSPRTPNPAGELVDSFAKRVGAQSGGLARAPQDARVLGVVHSAPVHELVDTMLTISDNVLAEALGRRVARSVGRPESFAGSVAAVQQVLTGAGFDYSGATLVDCSGLSTKDRLPARLLAGILAATAGPPQGDPRTPKLRPIIAGLPVAGGTGSLAAHERFQHGPAESGRGYVRAKTGTLSAVSDLAGLVLDDDGRVLVFAFMSTGSQISAARTGLDEMAATLQDCGCG